MPTAARPHVLFVTADVPWQESSGAKAHDLAIHDALGAVADHTLACFPIWVQPTAETPLRGALVQPAPWPRNPLRRAAIRVRATLRGRQVFQEHLLQQRALDRIREIAREERPEVIVLGHPFYAGFAAAVRPLAPRLIVDLWQLRAVGARQRLRTAAGLDRRVRAALDLLVYDRMEREVAANADEVWFVESRDAAIFERRHGVPVRVIPTHLRTDAYAHARGIEPRPRSIGFVGILYFDPNVAAATRILRGILPRLRAIHPDARAVIIGRSPPASLRELVARTPGAELRADVPDAMVELAEAGPLAAPLEAGTGIRTKLLEAAASRIPVVITPLGRAGLDFRPGHEVLEATSDEEFVAAILRLWEDPVLRTSLADAALERVRARYDAATLPALVLRGLRGEPEPR